MTSVTGYRAADNYVSAQVTRAADTAYMYGTNFSSWYRQDEGTLYAEASSYSVAGVDRVVTNISDGTLSNRIKLGQYSNYLNSQITTAGTVTTSVNMLTTTFIANQYVKGVFAYKAGDQAATSFGNAVGTGTAAIPVTMTQLDIGRLGVSNSTYLNGTIKRIAYYPKRISNTELQGVTS